MVKACKFITQEKSPITPTLDLRRNRAGKVIFLPDSWIVELNETYVFQIKNRRQNREGI